MKFLLDTDTCIYALKQNPAVLRHLLAQSRDKDSVLQQITEVIREYDEGQLREWELPFYDRAS